jgi:hypothetical protein
MGVRFSLPALFAVSEVRGSTGDDGDVGTICAIRDAGSDVNGFVVTVVDGDPAAPWASGGIDESLAEAVSIYERLYYGIDQATKESIDGHSAAVVRTTFGGALQQEVLVLLPDDRSLYAIGLANPETERRAAQERAFDMLLDTLEFSE